MENIHPHKLAQIFEAAIKDAVSRKFLVPVADLVVLLDDEDGVYMSQEEPATVCCLVLGQENGFLYLVTGKIQEKGEALTDFKADIVS